MLIGRFAGVGRVVTRLVDGLARRDDVQVVALCGREPFEPWKGRRDIEVVQTSFDRQHRTPDRRALWEEWHLPGIIGRSGAEVFHATWNTGVPARCPVPAVLTIHDLIPWHHPAQHFATWPQRAAYRYSVRASARRAAVITTVSDYVRGRVCGTLPVRSEKVITVHNGVDLPRDPLQGRSQTGAPYVLYVGGHQSRKNVAGVLRAMSLYWRRCNEPVQLRLAGARSNLCPEAVEAFEALVDPSRVVFLGQMDDEELFSQYAGATALLFLSYEEGFGLPVLEAMAHGCPVIAANRSSLPEVVGDAGLLVHPDDPEAVVNAVRRLVPGSPERAQVIERGLQRARRFSWDGAVERMLRVYETACKVRRVGSAGLNVLRLDEEGGSAQTRDFSSAIPVASVVEGQTVYVPDPLTVAKNG
jgi:glycosyltransferase involved in cell wall biosynthesis